MKTLEETIEKLNTEDPKDFFSILEFMLAGWIKIAEPPIDQMSKEELFNDEISIGISLLSPLVEVTFDNEKSLEQQLRPKTDGLVLSEGQNRGVFLPAVWDDISDPKSFIAQLKRKAGFQQNYWSNDLKAWRFVTFSISSKDLPEQLNLWLSN